MMEDLPVGMEPSSLDQDTVASMLFSGEHSNTADLSRATVRAAGDTTIPGAEIISPACPLNGCREYVVGLVGSPGAPLWPFLPGDPGSPGIREVPVILEVQYFPEVPAHKSDFCWCRSFVLQFGRISFRR